MDPFTALGAATNALQLFEVGWKLISTAKSIYRSSEGLSERCQLLRDEVERISLLNNAIIVRDDFPEQLQRMIETGKIIAVDLRDILSKLKAPEQHKKWNSLGIAVKELWVGRALSELSDRLRRLQRNATEYISFLAFNQQSQVYSHVLQLRHTANVLGMEMCNTNTILYDVQERLKRIESKALHEKIEQVLTEFKDAGNNKSNEDHVEDTDETPNHEPEDGQDQQQVTLDDISARLESMAAALSQLQHQMRDIEANQDVLQSLHFERLSARHNQIPVAHAETFSWAFKPTVMKHGASVDIHFVRWLQKGDGLFWIRGKAGSGKSTLMKFLCSDPKTMMHLGVWAGAKKPVIAKYFFWSAGTSLQKSQEGLLRSILFDVLRECPDTIATIKPLLQLNNEDQASHLFEDPWTREKLIAACKAIIAMDLPVKFCLMIDGLDEYLGDSEDLLKTIHELALCPDVKVCVSSRPWAEFIEAFGQDPKRLIKLEDLTSSDVRKYIHDKLFENRRFRRLATRDPSISMLEYEIADKSCGVFLWVFLVVRSLLEGVKYADSTKMLWQRVQTFPPDLDGFFQHMLDTVPDIYRSKTAKSFKYTMAAPEPMEPLVYHFLDCVEEEPAYALKTVWDELSSDEVQNLEDDVVDRLDGWTKGLLEVVYHHKNGATVQFLHRTVRDFICGSPAVQEMFDQALEDSFDTSEILCHALLALRRQRGILLELEDSILLDIFYHARTVYERCHSSASVFQVLDKACEGLVGSFGDDELGTTLATSALAGQFGLTDYFGSKLSAIDNTILVTHQETRLTRQWSVLLLADALSVLSKRRVRGDRSRRHESIRRKVKPTIVEYLVVDRKTDPNKKLRDMSVWAKFLRDITAKGEATREDVTQIPDIVRILSILVRSGGADSNIWISLRVGGEKTISTFRQAVKDMFEECDVHEILQPTETQPSAWLSRGLELLSHGFWGSGGAKTGGELTTVAPVPISSRNLNPFFAKA